MSDSTAADGGVNDPSEDSRIRAWVGRHPGWAYDVTGDGRHVVKDPLGGVAACDPDPTTALDTARRWA